VGHPAQTPAPAAPETVRLERSYPGTASQARRVRADLAPVAAGFPAAESLILLTSELVANTILHSRSGHPGRTFTVRVVLYLGEYAWVEVVDQGGMWAGDEQDEEHGRGLAIVAAIAGDGNWGIDGDEASRVAWFRLDWNQG
jgi:anti-sigma regulatory factor (Ser/Thr protein kinase)